MEILNLASATEAITYEMMPGKLVGSLFKGDYHKV